MTRAAAAARARRGLWLAPLVFLVHCLEELPRFPEWATRHFGTTTRPYYLASHAVLIPAVVALTRGGTRPDATPTATARAAAVPAGLIANAAFHVRTTRAFGGYSPGVLTGLGVVTPVCARVLFRLSRTGVLPRRELAIAVLAGVALNAVAVASLRVDAPRLGG